MKRSKSVEALVGRRWRLSHVLFVLAVLYLLIFGFKFQHVLQVVGLISDDRSFAGVDRPAGEENVKDVSHSLLDSANPASNYHGHTDGYQLFLPSLGKSSSSFDQHGRNASAILHSHRPWAGNRTELEVMAHEAWLLGIKVWNEAEKFDEKGDFNPDALLERKPEPCPLSVSMGKDEMGDEEGLMFLPCGLEVGSSITVIGAPHMAHQEYVPQLAKLRRGEGMISVAQFIVELQGLKVVDGEDPPKMLHFNPRLKGDWSRRSVIEHNTCYRMQWGKAMRCDGIASNDDDDDMVDGFRKCEKWLRNDVVDSKESKTTSWLKRFIGRAKKPEMTWPYPFVEGRLFVLTFRAGVEGFHTFVGGRHLTSFSYRPGFTLEDATGLAIKGNVDVHSVFATSLPKSHPRFSRQQVLELSEAWKSGPLPDHPVELFIGILSSTNHFAERMAVRKTWMQYSAIKLSNVVARFFVALSPRKEINVVLKKEAEFFGDVVILPFMDRYELVVLKTIAICEYGVQNLTAAYIMKCDDDTFVRLDVVLKEVKAAWNRSLYMGNLNLLHSPLRNGKWAVTFEEWPEEVYPPYANGPGYIFSSDIARFVASKHANQTLRMFKMEDVSMGMWVEEFNASTPVHYSHNWKFCQYGCIDNYYTSHYQSPGQMICLWDKLGRGRPQCCNFR